MFNLGAKVIISSGFTKLFFKKVNEKLDEVTKAYPTVPSRETLSSFWASTANSIGSFWSTSLA